jgi:hypothetical protein
MTRLAIINIPENVTYVAQSKTERSEAGNHTAGKMCWSIDNKATKTRIRIFLTLFWVYMLGALITGCTESTYNRVFNDRNYAVIEQSAHFKHLVVEHFPLKNSDELHIYIEGDGLPWIENAPTADPTPRNPLALELMHQDTGNAIYLGRPCYFNHYALGADQRCDVRYWTSARYSQQVIDDMSAIAARYIADKKPRKIILIGYSGGGVLATMMACALPKPIKHTRCKSRCHAVEQSPQLLTALAVVESAF